MTFIDETVAKLRALPPSPDVLGAALAHDALRPDDTWCEFGVATMQTITRLANARGRAEVWGFDSFRGLPEAWKEGDPAGQFAQPHIEIPPEGVRLCVGLFADTLPCWKPRSAVTFVHFDADLYSSTALAIAAVKPHLAPGAIVVFDELWQYPGFENHEMRALEESGLRVEWFAAGSDKAAGMVVT